MNCFVNKTALLLAVEKENTTIINLLLNNDNIDINLVNIFMKYFF